MNKINQQMNKHVLYVYVIFNLIKLLEKLHVLISIIKAV